jgi:hypothetical protein
MTTKRRKRHGPAQIVQTLRHAHAILNAGQDLAAVLQSLEVSEATFHSRRAQYGGMKADEAVRLKKLEEENRRLKELVAEKELAVRGQMVAVADRSAGGMMAGPTTLIRSRTPGGWAKILVGEGWAAGQDLANMTSASTRASRRRCTMICRMATPTPPGPISALSAVATWVQV